MGAEYFLRQIARRLNIAEQDVGAAGMKDRHAVTRQMVSVPVQAEERLPDLEGNGIRVLSVNRHTNKLRTGHLRGNRFTILIRHIDPAVDPSPILDRIARLGLPNYYGSQRFGKDGETVQLGMAMLRDEPAPLSATGKKPNRSPFLRKLALSAAQSALFNGYLAQRIADGLFRQVLPGDVMSKWPAGGLFVAEDVAREQERFDARETVTTGPIFGKKTFPARATAAEREAAILQQAELTADMFGRFGKLMEGTRRHNLVYIDDLSHAIEPDGVRLKFSLPAGSYATVLLREIMKTDHWEQE
jgi:tRNA pseudouridine13 synthase